MNKQRKTSHILNVFQYDADGHVVLPASLTLGITPTGEDNSAKVPTTAWVRSIVGGAVTAYAPTSRTITINGTSYDLSSNRSWSIDTGVLTASAGSGISVSVVSQNLNIVNTGLLTATSGSGISVSTVNQNLNIVNTGLLSATAGAGISVSTVSQNLNIVNTGLLTATAGSGITVSVVNQNLNVVNTGILTASAGSGISLSVVGQNLNVVNTGVLTASAGAGISLSIVDGNLNVVNTITNNNQLTNGAGYITSSALTGYATETYVGTQISNLVDAAPGTLDTLNELAAALGDDPNFATTVSTSIGTKVPQTRTLTINGTSYDLTANRSWTINSMVYPSAGIALSTGTAWGTSITDNSANWNTAFGWGNHASAGYAASSHTHSIADVTGLQTALDGKQASGSYAASSHSHIISDVTGLQTALDGKQASLGYTPYNSTNPSGYITSSALSSYLPLTGGTLTGPLTINTTGDIVANGDTFRMKGGGGSAEFIWYRNYSGSPSEPGFVINNRAGATTFSHNANGGGTSVSGNFSAANFSGSSSGTNTGDQTLSGLGGVPTSGYAFGTSFTLGTMYVGTGEQFTPTTLLGVYSNGYAYKFPVAGVQSWLGLGSLAYSSATIPTNNNQLTNGAGYITSAGNAATATTATYASYLNALTNYSWTSSSLPNTYHQGITSAFVGPSEGWQNYGSVMTMRTYSGGGGSLQLYTPYGPSNGGDSLQVRFGNYNVSTGNSWTGWKTLIDSGNISSQSVSYASTAGSATTATNFNNGYAYSSGSTVYVDTLESISSTDWLELVYYGGVGVRIGTGVNGSKALYAGSLYDAGNRVYSAGNPQVDISGNSATTSQRNFDGSLTSPDFYASGWFRTTGATAGLYNSTHNTHFYASGTGQWNFATSNGSWIQIALRPASHESTVRGYIYADTNNNVGLLTNDGNWGLRVDVSKNVQIYGSVSATNLSGTNTGDQTNISGNAATATSAATVTGSSTINGYLTLSTNWGVSPYTSAFTIIGTHPSMTFRGSNGDTHYLMHMDSAGDIQYYFGPGYTTNNWTRRYEFSKGGNFTVVTGTISATNFSGSSSGTNTGDQTNVTGYSNYVNRVANYVWNNSTLPTGYNSGIETSFVSAAEGWPNYGVVLSVMGRVPADPGGNFQLYMGHGANYGGLGLRVRSVNQSNNLWTSWKILLDETNYNSYAPTLTGGGASGTWAISISGTAASISGYNNPTAAATANTIVYRDGSGHITGNYILGSYFNSSAGNSENPTIGQIWTQSTGDNYLRKSTPAHLISQLGLVTGGPYLPLSGGTMNGVITLNDNGYLKGSPSYGFRFNNSADSINAMIINNSGDVTAYSSMRAPIFYDSNDTSYYLNPAGGSRLRNLYVGDSGDDWSDPGGWGTQIRFSNGPHVKFVLHARTPGIEAGMYVHTPGSVFIGSYTSHDVSLMYGGSRKMGFNASYIYTDVYLEAAGSVRAPIFYDSNDTGYYLDPNGTSNLQTWTADTAARLGRSSYWTNRWAIYNGVNGHMTGTNGWGMDHGGWGTAWKGGFSGWDIWGTSTDHPQGSGYVHAQGIISGQHAASSDGSSAYGWMMVGAHNATDNRYWLRGKWSTSTSGWVEMVTSGNISSQTVSNSDMVDGYHASNFLGYQGNSYYQVNTWLQMNGTHGIYWPSYYGSHLYVNTTTTYTQFRMDGNKNGYDGVWLSYSSVNGMMYDSAGNGGVYREANGRWYWYHHIGNNCTGISTSTTSSSYRAYIGGALYAEGDIVAYSDVRKKTDIITIDNALNKVINLRGVYYTRIDDPQRGRQTGVIAQEINEVLPEVVTYASDLDEYGVSYGNIVGVLIEAIKEQQLQIEELKNKLNNVLSSR